MMAYYFFDEIEDALEHSFSLHDVGYIMNLLIAYRDVEEDYIDDEDGFNSFLRNKMRRINE